MEWWVILIIVIGGLIGLGIIAIIGYMAFLAKTADSVQ